MISVNTNWIALIAVAVLAGCEASAASAPTQSQLTAVPTTLSPEAAALATRGLGASSLPKIQLLATSAGRTKLSRVIACALPAGDLLTAIASDGTPYTFTGRMGLAPSWVARAPSATERQKLAGCLGVVRARG